MSENSTPPDVSMQDMGTDSVPKLLAKYSLPSMLGLFAIAFYETIDRIFVGQFVGNSGLAVMAGGMAFVILLGAMCIMLRVGAASVLSRSLGQGDTAQAGQVLGNALTLLFTLGVVMAGAAILAAGLLAELGGANEATMAETIRYISIIAVGAPLLFLSNGANALLRAVGMPRKGLLLIVGSCATNVILDGVFVAGLDWGVPGAAWATVLAQGVGAVYGLYHLLGGRHLLSLRREDFRPRFSLARELVGVGAAYAMYELNFMIVVAITNNMLESYGDALALAGIAVVSSCVTFLYTPVTGLDEGLQPVIGYNFGAGNRDRVRRIALWALGVGVLFFTVSFLVIQVGSEQIIALFVDDNAEFQAMTARALRITFSVAPLMAFMIVIPGILSALGEVRYNLLLSAGIQFSVQIPALLILPRFYGVDGIWFSFPLVDVVASMMGLLFLYKSFRRHGLLGNVGV